MELVWWIYYHSFSCLEQINSSTLHHLSPPQADILTCVDVNLLAWKLTLILTFIGRRINFFFRNLKYFQSNFKRNKYLSLSRNKRVSGIKKKCLYLYLSLQVKNIFIYFIFIFSILQGKLPFETYTTIYFQFQTHFKSHFITF